MRLSHKCNSTDTDDTNNIDKTGVQVQSFKAGTHTVGVKVVNNEGLESVEIIKLKINGVVTVH
jgi:hypothetical protein